MRAILFCVALGLFSGCQHTHLRYNTVRQAGTLSEIFEQQVLDNLAMFVHDPHALPFFAYPEEGSASIEDAGTIGFEPLIDFWQVMTAEASRTGLEQWGLTPVCEPDKLALMQAAYQQAVYGQKLDPCNEASRDEKCAIECGWLCHGCKRDVPRNSCLLVGEHCGTYVWVNPEYKHHLTRLVLRVLDYAINDGTRQKVVTINVDRDGQPAKAGDAVGKVEAVIDIDEPIDTVITDSVSTMEATPATNMDGMPPSANRSESSSRYSTKQRTDRPIYGDGSSIRTQRQQRALQP